MAEWQTRTTQNRVGLIPHESSTLSLATRQKMRIETQCDGCKYINTLRRGDVAEIRALGPAGVIATSFSPSGSDGTMIIEHNDDSPGSTPHSPGYLNQKKLEDLARQAGRQIEEVINPSA